MTRALLEQALVALIGMQFHASAKVRKMDPASEVIEEIRAHLASPQAQPERNPHVGDSSFESWYASHQWIGGNHKQLARDAYAAGMGVPAPEDKQ